MDLTMMEYYIKFECRSILLEVDSVEDVQDGNKDIDE